MHVRAVTEKISGCLRAAVLEDITAGMQNPPPESLRPTAALSQR